MVTTWQGLFAPAGTPAAVLARINAEFAKAVHSPELKPRLEQQDMEPTGPGVGAFTAMYRAELQKWTKVARDAGCLTVLDGVAKMHERVRYGDLRAMLKDVGGRPISFIAAVSPAYRRPPPRCYGPG